MPTDPDDSNYDRQHKPTINLLIRKFINKYPLIDLAFVAFIAIMIAYYVTIISMFSVPVGDGVIYMIVAREWLSNSSLTETFRPPLFSWIIDGIWTFIGENWMAIKYVQMIFTIAGVVLLYVTLRRKKSALFAFGVSALTLTNAQLFFYTSQMLTEGISLFFLLLTLYFLEGTKKAHWVLSGISIGLTFAARYPILLQAMTIFAVKSILKKDLKSTTMGAIAIVSVILLVVAIVYTKTGSFQMALEKDSSFGTTLSPYYILNALPIWGPAIVLVPISFLFKSTYKDKFNYIFVAWFIISFLSWSTNATNHQYRFMIQFMPAAYYLVILAIENLILFDRNNLIFIKCLRK